jgi:hypothetical protein
MSQRAHSGLTAIPRQRADADVQSCRVELMEAMNRSWETLDSQAYLLLRLERTGIPRIEVPIEKIREVQENG